MVSGVVFRSQFRQCAAAERKIRTKSALSYKTSPYQFDAATTTRAAGALHAANHQDCAKVSSHFLKLNAT